MVNPDSGYRYYDIFNVSEIMQYQMFRTLGLSAKEIVSYYRDEDFRAEDVLAGMRERLELLRRGVEEFSLRFSKESNCSFSYVTFPDMLCYCVRGDISCPEDMATIAFNAHNEAARRGYPMLATEPIFSMRFDEGQGRGGEVPVPYPAMACIPIGPELPKGLPTDGVERIPGCRALSLLYYGKYDAPGAFNEPRKLLWEEFERRGHVPAGPLRGVGIVAPYVGMQIDRERQTA